MIRVEMVGHGKFDEAPSSVWSTRSAVVLLAPSSGSASRLVVKVTWSFRRTSHSKQSARVTAWCVLECEATAVAW